MAVPYSIRSPVSLSFANQIVITDRLVIDVLYYLPSRKFCAILPPSPRMLVLYVLAYITGSFLDSTTSGEDTDHAPFKYV